MLCFTSINQTWQISHWHPFVLPHPTKYSVVVAQFECVLNIAGRVLQEEIRCVCLGHLSLLPLFQENSFSHLIPLPSLLLSPLCGWGDSFRPKGGWKMSFKCVDWAWKHHHCNSGCFWLCRGKGVISLLPFFAGPQSLPGSEAGMPQLLFFPLTKTDFYSFANESDMAQLMSWGSENELQWDFMLIFVFLLKIYILI